MNFSSKILEEAVIGLSGLPSIGKKTALRLALYMVQQEPEKVKKLAEALSNLAERIHHCLLCHNLSDEEICHICKDTQRDQRVICVVESVRDVMAIEETGQFKGLYHILGGVISPIDGVGPDQLHIATLIQRVMEKGVEEMIMALSPTIEGDTTIFFISKQFKDMDIKISTIARGVSFGGELEYADEVTLGRSIISRIPYQS
jgi:recombination protein RecR